MNVIETRKLTKYYGTHRGIADADLQVKEGWFFGFIGPNGSGKSTTIRTLLGLIQPTRGEAEIFGKSVLTHKQEILSKIGYLPSETQFYGNMRVRDLIRLSANLRKTDCQEEAQILCERLELDPNRKIRELSLGNRKKVGIVCALQHTPPLYILDEPTSGLDPLIQKEFYTILQERNAKGATIFLSSHILSEVAKYCTHAAVIRDGQILVCDSIDRMARTGTKMVRLKGASQVPSLTGISKLKEEDGSLRFLYQGDVQVLLQSLASLPLKDLTITDPDPEEIFLNYYKEEEGA
ncbi:MAG: ABC transporter ATP-binding protein [Oscillospiraceae bacterium]|nr:ABC transporter ATP-binding protein [Oscillospiraceae bacterium]